MARYVRIDGFPETPEDVFGMTIKGLLAQGVPSIQLWSTIVTDQYRCFYRSVSQGVEVACGAGLWIPDKVYRPDMEGRPFSVIAHHLGDKWKRPFLSSALSQMQNIHDNAAKRYVRSSGNWPHDLRVEAEAAIRRMSESVRTAVIPTHWEEFFNPE